MSQKKVDTMNVKASTQWLQRNNESPANWVQRQACTTFCGFGDNRSEAGKTGTCKSHTRHDSIANKIGDGDTKGGRAAGECGRNTGRRRAWSAAWRTSRCCTACSGQHARTFNPMKGWALICMSYGVVGSEYLRGRYGRGRGRRSRSRLSFSNRKIAGWCIDFVDITERENSTSITIHYRKRSIEA